MPYSPEPRRRPWLPERNKKEQKHQGRTERTDQYNTARWKNARARHLRNNPLCVECKAKGTITEATVLDHRIQVRAGADFWDEDNWQGLCQHHHSVKSAKERHGKV